MDIVASNVYIARVELMLPDYIGLMVWVRAFSFEVSGSFVLCTRI